MSDHRHQGGEEYELRIIAQADDAAPPIIRLRKVLKGLLRAHGFRCTSCRDITAYPAGAPAEPVNDDESPRGGIGLMTDMEKAMGYDREHTKPTQPPPAGLSDQQRQLIDAMYGVAEHVRDDLHLFVEVLALLRTCSAPSKQMRSLARNVAYRLATSANTANSTAQSIWDVLAKEQAAEAAGQAPSAPTEQTLPAAVQGERLALDDVPALLMQRRCDV